MQRKLMTTARVRDNGRRVERRKQRATIHSLTLGLLALLIPMAASAAVTEIIDGTGDGGGNALVSPLSIVVDASGNAYVSGGISHNAFKITPGGVVTQIIDATGDGAGNTLDGPWGMAVDATGNVYVAGPNTDNVFKITPGGTITEVIDATGDGAGNGLDNGRILAADASGNVFVAGLFSHNVLKIDAGGVITEIIDITGDGAGNTLNQAFGMGADAAGNAYVTGELSNNAFKITPGGVVTQIIDATGDGAGNVLDGPSSVAADAAGNVYVAGRVSDNVFKITPGGTITEVIDATGDGAGNALDGPMEVVADGAGNVYVAARQSDNAFRITPGGVITEILDITGDGAGNPFDFPYTIGVDSSDSVYTAGRDSNNAFKIAFGPNLTIATSIPAAELETVEVDVDFAGNGTSTAATVFSVDYDHTCLSFDDTDANADNIPDDLAFSVPAGFAVTAFHDLGDTDGEIDVTIADLAPPLSPLPDGALLTITFTATCSPALGTTITAPMAFSSDPSATFSDDLAVDLDGTTADGSVEIWPGPRGDCNGTGAVSAGDLIGGALEIFDADGTFWTDAPGSTFAGSPVGCDANADTSITAGDISCIVLRIFGGTCGGSPFTLPGENKALTVMQAPVLGLERARRGADGTLWIPVAFSAGSHAVSSVAFSLDLADRGLVFDPFDGDGDGVPDAVRFPGTRPDLIDVRYNHRDRDGELDLTLATFDGVLADGLLLEVAVRSRAPHALSGAMRSPARFSKMPEASFGNLAGQDVAGHALVIAQP